MNPTALSNLIALGEGFTTEFKQAMPSDLGREICSFANATGGVILIGADDAGTVVGVGDHNRLKSRVQSIARSADPPVAVEIESAGEVLCVTVPEQHGKPYSFGGRFFIREGASSQQMSRDEIREFFFKEGLIRLDETPCSAFDPSVEITPARWMEFAERAGIDLDAGTDDGAGESASRQGSGDDPRRSVAPGRRYHPFHASGRSGHAPSFAVMPRRTSSTVRSFTETSTPSTQEAMGYLQAKLNSALIPNAHGRDERLKLPESALREALVNAIAHRDYRSTASVHVYIFQDRVEIVTPSGLPAGMREEELGSKSVPRNPLLFSMLYRMKLVEQIGSGIRRIRDACREYGIDMPAINVSPDWVTVTFPRRNASGAPHVAPHLTPQVSRLIAILRGEMGRAELMVAWA